MSAELSALVSEIPASDFVVTTDSGAINESNKSSYHISGRCPVESTTVQFDNTTSTLACVAGLFDGFLDFSAAAEGPHSVQLQSSNGLTSNWNALKDTSPPVVLVGNPVTNFTGLNKSLSIPVSFSDTQNINITSSDILISGTGVNNCSVGISGSGVTARTLTLSNCDQAAGSLTLSIKAGIATDSAGNISLLSNSSAAMTIDNVAPLLAANQTGPTAGNASSSFSWELDFTNADQISLAASDVVLSGATTGCTKTLTGTGLLQRALTVTNCSGNGSLNIQIPAGAGLDLANNPTAVLNLTAVTVDNLGPSLVLSAPTPTSGNSGTTFSWTVTYTGAATITLANADIQFTGASTGCAATVSGTGTVTRTVQVSGCLDTGSLQIKIAAGSASDAAGNLAPASALSGAVSIVNAALGLALSGPTPATINAAGSAQFSITYTNAVNYALSTTDITLSGTTAGCTKALSGTAPNYILTIASCSGNGTVQVSVAANTANDGSGNNAPAAGPSANLTIDNLVPTLAVVGPTPTLGTSATTFSWTLNFTGASAVTLANADVTFTGAAAGCMTTVSGTGLSTRTITVTSCSGTGALNLSIPAGVLSDAAGNISAANAALGAVTLDNSAPTLSIGAPSPTTGTTSTTFVWPITYSGANTVTLANSDVSLTTALTGCAITVSGSGTTNRNVSVTSCVGEGSLKITINAGTASDTAGNLAAASAISTQVLVDSNAPTIAFGAGSPSSGNSSTSFSWVLTFTGADVVTMTNADVVLDGATSGCTAAVTGSGITQRTVTVTNCSGSGNLGIKIAANAISDTAGNGNTLTSVSGTVAVSNGAPTIAVSGLPIGHSNANSITTNTTGNALVSYVYKLGPSSSIDCTIGTGFSTAQALGNLTHDLSAFGAIPMTACFKGQDSFSNWSSVLEQRWSRNVVGGGVSSKTNICGDPISVTSNLSTNDVTGVLVDSGGDSADYVNVNESCTYVIDTGSPITLKIDSFESENNYDRLKIYDGTTGGTELSDLTGTITTQSFTANSGKMTLVWTSDSSVSKPGFVISWGGVSPYGDDYDPADFALTNVLNGTVSTLYSTTFTVTGISGIVMAGVSGYDSQIRNNTTAGAWGTWTTVSNGDSVSVRMTSGATTTANRTAVIRVGNLQKNWLIYWDTNAPTGSITIAGGATNSLTTSTTLALAATDPETSPIQMYITQAAGCGSGGTWVSFASSSAWTLQNEGQLNTVYVKYRDEALNEGPCYNDTIYQYNNVNPVAVLTSSSPDSTGSGSVNLTITFNEPITGLALGDFTMVNSTIGSLSGSGKVYTATVTPLGPGVFSATLPANKVVDLQGNQSDASNVKSWISDNVPPTPIVEVSSTLVNAPFIVHIHTDDETVPTIDASALTVTNANATLWSTSATEGVTTYHYYVNPTTEGNVTVKIAAAAFTDAAGNANVASNIITVKYIIRPQVNFAGSYSVFNEGNGTTARTIGITISPAKSYSFDIRMIRSDIFSTAPNGVLHDLAASTTVTIPANATTANLTFNTIGNATDDGDKILQLSLTADSGEIEVGAQDTHTVLIKDDEHTTSVPLYQAADANAVITLDSADNKIKGIGTGPLPNEDASLDVLQITPITIDPSTTFSFMTGNNRMGLGITSAGVLKQWGNWANASGSAGAGPGTTVQDSGVSYKLFDTADVFTAQCGITTADKIRCHGNNDQGQLLTGDAAFQSNFVSVDATNTYKMVATTADSICAIRSTDALYCWGKNSHGEVGVGTTAIVANPTLIDSGTAYAKIYGGRNQFCAITTAGELKCWGDNYRSRLGTGDGTDRSSPTLIDAGTSYAQVNVENYWFNCGLTTGQVLKCWGDASNLLAPAPVVASTFTVPTAVLGAKTFSTLFGSDANICATDTNNVTFCSYPVTQVKDKNTLITAAYSDSFTKMVSSTYYSCGLKTNGMIKCANAGYIPLGDGLNNISRSQYLPLMTPDTFIDISATEVACGVTSGGKLSCWGTHNAQPWDLNNSTAYEIPAPSTLANAPPNLRKVYTSSNNICVLDVNGDPYCQGKNLNGVFGDGTTTPSSWVFKKPTTAAKFTKMSYSNTSVCGITTTGVLMCWGKTPGDGSAESLVPVVVDSGTSYIDITVNDYTRCAVTSANVLKCWGMNNGSMGLGSANFMTYTTPQVGDVGNSYTKVKILEYAATCGITTSNQLRCFGANSPYPINPVTVDGGTTYFDITDQSDNICAITTGGIHKCFGANPVSLGSGKALRGLTPIAVTH